MRVSESEMSGVNTNTETEVAVNSELDGFSYPNKAYKASHSVATKWHGIGMLPMRRVLSLDAPDSVRLSGQLRRLTLSRPFARSGHLNGHDAVAEREGDWV